MINNIQSITQYPNPYIVTSLKKIMHLHIHAEKDIVRILFAFYSLSQQKIPLILFLQDKEYFYTLLSQSERLLFLCHFHNFICICFFEICWFFNYTKFVRNVCCLLEHFFINDTYVCWVKPFWYNKLRYFLHHR